MRTYVGEWNIGILEDYLELQQSRFPQSHDLLILNLYLLIKAKC